MQIGTIAKKAGLSVDTIRFYERNALLPPAPRSEGGFRQYGESDIETLGFVRRTQGLGFTLGEVRELLALRQIEPPAAVRSGAPPSRTKASPRASQAHRPSEAGARTAARAPKLQPRTAQTIRALPASGRQKPT